MKIHILEDGEQQKPAIETAQDVCVMPGICDGRTVWFRAQPDASLSNWIVDTKHKFHSSERAAISDYAFNGTLCKSIIEGTVSRAKNHIHNSECNTQAMHDLEILVEAAELLLSKI